MDALFNHLRVLTGASVDQLKLIFCLLVSYPLGSLYVRLPYSRPELKHLFSIAISTCFLLPGLNLWLGALQLLGSVLGTYVLASTLTGRNMPWIVFAFVMGHLTLNHVYRATYQVSLETFDITAPQMVLTMKLTKFAWNVWDGRRPVEDLDKWQLKHRIVAMPSLLEFLGYAFYFPGVLVGPATEYATYASLIDGSLFSSPERQETVSHGKHVPRGRKRVAYSRMLLGICFLGIFATLGTKFPYETILTDSWLRKGFLHRLFLVQVYGFVARTKYYAVWTLTEGACILTGLGFTGFGPLGNSRWDGTANVDIPSIEWPSNPKMIFDSWNMKTNVWLRECVYKRVTPKGKKPGFKSSMITFITSAFWHGFEGGYYLAFLFAGFMPATGRLCRTYIRPLLLPLISESGSTQPTQPKEASHKHGINSEPSRTIMKMIYDFVGSIACIVTLNFAAAPFIICGFRNSLEVWRRMDWYGIWILGGTILFVMGGKSWLKGLMRRRLRKAEKRREEETKGVKIFGRRFDERTSGLGPHTIPPVDLAISEVARDTSITNH